MRIDYPRAGKSGVRRLLPSWRQWLGMALLGAGIVVAGALWAYEQVAIPSVNATARAQTTVLYYSDGETELGRLGSANRTSVAIGAVPAPVKYAVLSAEDRSFYEHRGVDPVGVGRAAWNNVRGGSTQGGSTITQQLAKNLYLTQERTVDRKARELVLAVKLENTLSKDQILEDYLNTIYFGRGAYGIQAAAQAYFAKDVGELTAAEAAVLASVVRSPGGYAPEDHLDRLQGRWAYVLDGMVDRGWLTQAERDAAQFPAIGERRPAVKLSGTTGYLVDTARRELDRLGYTEDQLSAGGLRITTTYDVELQAAAEAAVAKQRPTKKADGVRVGLVAVEPGTGYVKAMYGGEDYQARQYNDATQSAPQAGSTFKPFALAAALEDGVKLTSTWDGRSPRTFEVEGREPYKVANFDDQSYGRISLLKATANSVNTAYVDLGLKIGDDKVVDAARRAGIPDKVQIDAGPAVVLGTASVTAYQLADAYATFANDGARVPATTIISVKTPAGGTLYLAKPKADKVFSPAVVADLTKALQGVVENGSGFEAKKLGRPSAGKTGTSQDNKSAWYVGYTGQLAVAIDLFRPNEAGELQSLKGVGGMATLTGGSYPARIWTSFMKAALDGAEVVPLPGQSATPSPSRTAKAKPKATASPSATEPPSPSPSDTAPAEPTPSPSSSAPAPPAPPAATSPPAPPASPAAPA